MTLFAKLLVKSVAFFKPLDILLTVSSISNCLSGGNNPKPGTKDVKDNCVFFIFSFINLVITHIIMGFKFFINHGNKNS